MPSATKEEVLERIAQLVLYDVPHRQIAQTVGLSEGRLSQLVNDDEQFQQILSEKSIAHHEEMQTVNDGWDALEAQAIERMLQYINMTSDPEFMIKVAAVANKAQRRGRYSNDTIKPQGNGSHVVINLNGAFVGKMQENFKIITDRKPKLLQKEADAIAPEKIKEMLASDKMKVEENADSRLGSSTIDHDALSGLMEEGEEGDN